MRPLTAYMLRIAGAGPMDGARFASPLMLLLIPVLLWLWWRSYNRKLRPAVVFSTISGLTDNNAGFRVSMLKVAEALRVFGLLLLILALSRPQGIIGETELITEGVDIMICLDISSSMLAEDFQPKNRMDVAQQATKAFIDSRPNDRIGLVAFAGEAYTKCPLTLDHDLLKELVDQARPGLVADGTAIGNGLALSLNRLRDSEASTRLIVLVTDGRNNTGEIEPETAAYMAKSMDIPIYSIGTGGYGPAPFPVDDPIFGRRYTTIDDDLNDEFLTELSAMTGGSYFRADDTERTYEVYQELSELITSEIETRMYFHFDELFHIPLIAGLVLLGVHGFLGATLLRRLP